jgi:hypothetical protein
LSPRGSVGGSGDGTSTDGPLLPGTVYEGDGTGAGAKEAGRGALVQSHSGSVPEGSRAPAY